MSPEKRQRAAKLRDGIAKLGPVFVKMAQTLSTRPDIIGEEAADSLMVGRCRLPLVRFSAQPESFLSLEPLKPPNVHLIIVHDDLMSGGV